MRKTFWIKGRGTHLQQRPRKPRRLACGVSTPQDHQSGQAVVVPPRCRDYLASNATRCRPDIRLSTVLALDPAGVATRGGVSTPQDSGPSGRCSPLRYQPNLVSNATICRLDTRRSNAPALPAHYLGHKNHSAHGQVHRHGAGQVRTFGEADLRPWASWCRRFRAPASSGRLPLPLQSPWHSRLPRAAPVSP